MGFKDLRIQLLLRMSLLTALIGLWFFILFRHPLPFSLGLVGLLIVGLIWELLHFLNRSNRELKRFLEAIRFHDHSTRFELAQFGPSFRALESEFQNLLKELKGSRDQQHSQEEWMALILQQINLGIIVVNGKDQIFMMNEKAREILRIPAFTSWQRLREKRPALARAVRDFSVLGRTSFRMEQGQQSEELLLDIDQITLKGERYHLLSLSDLRNEIEQKEIDAWHKLIRILAHEVMNSVTPVASLSETLLQMLQDDKGRTKTVDQLDQEDLEDIREALQTVVRRSKGMLSFVEDYRKLTRLPAPHLETVSIQGLFKDLEHLLQKDYQQDGITLQFELPQKRLAIQADQKMIEQTLLNLVKNAYAALRESGRGKEIVLSAIMEDERVVITVRDDGPGIPEAVLPQIFIPFYSTRKNGTGIGLTLSKNIMKLHRGDLRVQSVEGEGSVFKLLFNEV